MGYPISYPFAKFMYCIGFVPRIRVDFMHDNEADVFVATSDDVKGLVIEAETFDQMTQEVEEAINNLFELNNTKHRAKTNADLIFKDHIVIA